VKVGSDKGCDVSGIAHEVRDTDPIDAEPISSESSNRRGGSNFGPCFLRTNPKSQGQVPRKGQIVFEYGQFLRNG